MKSERIVKSLLEDEADDYLRDFSSAKSKETECCGADYQVSKSTRDGTRIFCRKCGHQTRLQRKVKKPVPESLDQGQAKEAGDLMGKARYAAAYRSALHKVGLKPTDVVQRFGGVARQFALSNLRRGKYINAVETKDGRRVKLDPPVEVPPQTPVRGHGDNPTWMARLRLGQPRVTAEQAREQRERLARQVQAMELAAQKRTA